MSQDPSLLNVDVGKFQITIDDVYIPHIADLGWSSVGFGLFHFLNNRAKRGLAHIICRDLSSSEDVLTRRQKEFVSPQLKRFAKGFLETHPRPPYSKSKNFPGEIIPFFVFTPYFRGDHWKSPLFEFVIDWFREKRGLQKGLPPPQIEYIEQSATYRDFDPTIPNLSTERISFKKICFHNSEVDIYCINHKGYLTSPHPRTFTFERN